MATTTYEWVFQTNFQMNDQLEQGNQGSPAVAGLAKGGYFSAWNGPNGSYIQARVTSGSGVPLADEFGATSATANQQFEASLAGLANGRAVMAFTDYSADDDEGDIAARMFKKNGDPVFVDFPVSASSTEEDFEPDIAPLADGGFVVTWTRDQDSDDADFDVHLRVFNADGSPRTEVDGVTLTIATDARRSSVAGLADGNFVVAWEQTPDEGGDIDLYFGRYDTTGELIGSFVPIADGFGDQYDVQLLALQDGGFAAAYTNTGAPFGEADDISFRIFNADDTPRTLATMANFSGVAGNQIVPSLTQLSNGYILVGWNDGFALTYQLFTSDGDPVGENLGVAGSTIEPELVALGGGLVANVRSSLVSDGSGNSIQSSIDELVRTTTGDATAETLNGDDLADHMLGGGGKDKLSGFNGKDTLEGGAGDDVLRGGAGRDQLIGETGADKLVFSDVLQSRPSPGADLVKGFEDGVDKIDVAAIDARTGTAGDQAFVFGTGAFSGEGQIRAVQSGADAIVRFNVSGADTPEMEIVLKNFAAADVDATDFVL